MTFPVVTLTPDTPLKVAASILLDRRTAAAPVVRDDCLIGMLSVIDILRDDVPQDPTAHLLPVRTSRSGPRTVGDVMTADVLAFPPETGVADLLDHMQTAGVRSDPITRGQLVVGIVSRRDLLVALARPDEDVLLELRGRLRRALPDGDRWGLTVQDGTAVLWPLTSDPADVELARVVAAAVTGVQHVRVQTSPA